MKRKIIQLKDYFSKRQDVLFAFLFGSKAKGAAGKISDWDVAIYLKPKRGSLEWEETDTDYPQENEIWDDLIDILQTDSVDLVVLNRAPSNIAASAIRGVPLVIKERRVFLDFMLVVIRQALDYAHFVDNFYSISERSFSLSGEDRERLAKIIKFLEEEMGSYNYFSTFNFKDYSDTHKARDVERWVENILNAAIDIGEIILASEKKRIPDYYRDVFVQLGLLPQFKGINVERFTEWVKLCNILAHEYLDIKWKRLEKFIKESQPHFKSFLKDAKKFLA